MKKRISGLLGVFTVLGIVALSFSTTEKAEAFGHSGTYKRYGNIHVCNGKSFDCVVQNTPKQKLQYQ